MTRSPVPSPPDPGESVLQSVYAAWLQHGTRAAPAGPGTRAALHRAAFRILQARGDIPRDESIWVYRRVFVLLGRNWGLDEIAAFTRLPKYRVKRALDYLYRSYAILRSQQLQAPDPCPFPGIRAKPAPLPQCPPPDLSRFEHRETLSGRRYLVNARYTWLHDPGGRCRGA